MTATASFDDGRPGGAGRLALWKCSERKDIPQCKASLELGKLCLMRCNLAIWKLRVLTATHGRESYGWDACAVVRTRRVSKEAVTAKLDHGSKSGTYARSEESQGASLTFVESRSGRSEAKSLSSPPEIPVPGTPFSRGVVRVHRTGPCSFR